MRKAITPVISIIILLLITISLSGMGWTYMSGYYEAMTSKQIKIVEGSAMGNEVMILNIGTSEITEDDIRVMVNGKEEPLIDMNPSTLEPKKSARVAFFTPDYNENVNVRLVAGGSSISYSHNIEPEDVQEWPGSCQEILNLLGTAGDGLYLINPDGPGGSDTFEAYCDMTTDGGGWTLVLLSNEDPTSCPITSWDEVVNEVNYNRQLSTDLTSFDLFMGLKYWNLIGNRLRMEIGSDPSSLNHMAYYDVSLDAGSFYTISLSNEQLAIGARPGLYATHNNEPMTTYDADHDGNAAVNCAHNYNNAAWWYEDCWSGSFWGECGPGNYEDRPYWVGSGSSNYPWGAIWIR